MDDLPEHVVVDGVTYTRIDSDDSLACWTSTLETEGLGDSRSVSLVVEPAAVPASTARELAATVRARFDEFADAAADYLHHRLSEDGSGLVASELVKLDAPKSPFGSPEAVIWGDGTWMLRFAESSLEMADPYGIGVLFEGTTPTAVEDLSEAVPA